MPDRARRVTPDRRPRSGGRKAYGVVLVLAVVAGVTVGWRTLAERSSSPGAGARTPAPHDAPPVRTAMTRSQHRTAASAVLGLPSVKPGPVPGYILVADRNNDRLLILSPA